MHSVYVHNTTASKNLLNKNEPNKVNDYRLQETEQVQVM